MKLDASSKLEYDMWDIEDIKANHKMKATIILTYEKDVLDDFSREFRNGENINISGLVNSFTNEHDLKDFKLEYSNVKTIAFSWGKHYMYKCRDCQQTTTVLDKEPGLYQLVNCEHCDHEYSIINVVKHNELVYEN